MLKTAYFPLVALLMGVSVIVGCSKSVRYGDPKGVETVTIEFGSTDLQSIAEQMTRSIFTSPLVV